MSVRSALKLIGKIVGVALVVCVVLILGAFMMSAFWKARQNIRLYPLREDAREVMAALLEHARHNQGRLPHAEGSSNEALAQLFDPTRTKLTESPFHHPVGRRFCSWREPDGVTTPGKALEAGENHWAYVTGLTQTYSPAQAAKIPVLASGFDAPNHRYRGGHWFRYGFGNRTVVGFLDGSVRIVKIAVEADSLRILAEDDPKLDLFCPENLRKLTGRLDVKVLNPLPAPETTGTATSGTE